LTEIAKPSPEARRRQVAKALAVSPNPHDFAEQQ
jgi:hypothetical protein